jgi:glycosyltransferase involved in cell wall biosynthesis
MEDIHEDFLKYGYEPISIVSKDSEVVLRNHKLTYYVDVPHSLWEVLRFPAWALSLTKTAFLMKKSEVKEVLFVMPQPFDYLLARVLRLLGVQTSYVIHDHKAHSGEIWPLKSSMLARVRISKNAYFLSEYVSKFFVDVTESTAIHISKLEARRKKGFEEARVFGIDGEYFVFAGRIKDYKGIDRLLNAWNLIPGNERKLVIAGKGVKKVLRENIECRNLILIDKWMTNEELWNLIGNSDGLVAAYEEATQSGIIAIAVNLGVPVLATNVGGLNQQLASVSNAILVENTNEGLISGLIQLRVKTKVLQVSGDNEKLMDISLQIINSIYKQD